jgi:DNA invertase Pin-like site-specific DNA recombinase
MPARPSSAARSRPQPPVLGHVGRMATAVARFKPAYSGPFQTRRVGLRGFKLNPALLSYVIAGPRGRPQRRSDRHRRERRVRKRLEAESIERLVAEYATGTPAAELGRRYGLAKSSVLRLVRQAGDWARYPRFSQSETARLLELFEDGMAQKDIAERLGRSPSAVWHCLRRLGRA